MYLAKKFFIVSRRMQGQATCKKLQEVADLQMQKEYVLIDWVEGRTGKYLAWGQGVRTECSPDQEPNIFPSGPTLLSQ